MNAVTGRFVGKSCAVVRELLRTNPSNSRWAPALSAGIAMLLAVGLPTMAGAAEFGLMASLGALSALYLNGRSRRSRARELPLVGLGLVVAAGIGVATAGTPLLASIGLLVASLASALVVLGLHVGPPGALFGVLVAGVGQRLATPSWLGGPGVPPGLVLIGVATGAIVAYAVVTAPLLLPGVRRRSRAELRAPTRFLLSGEDRFVVVRLGIGVALVLLTSELLGLARPYWAVLAVVAVLQSVRARRPSMVRAAHRLGGTAVGVGIFALLALSHPHGLALVALLAVLQFLTELIVVRHYGLALTLITPLALFISGSADGDIADTVRVRLWDTLIGCTIATLILILDFAIERSTAHRR